MDFLVKVFTRLMALAVVVMPCYGIAALQSSVQVQGNVLPGVQVGFEASTVNAFKTQVDDAKRGAVKRYARKRTQRRPGSGILKSTFSWFLGAASWVLLTIAFVWTCVFLIFPIISWVPASLAGAVLFAVGGVLLARASSNLEVAAEKDLRGRDEFILVQPDEYAEYDAFYEEPEGRQR